MSFQHLSREQLLELIEHFLEQHEHRDSVASQRDDEHTRLLSELRLYQLELEVQNRELRTALHECEESRDRERTMRQCLEILDRMHVEIGHMLSHSAPAQPAGLLALVGESLLELFDARRASVQIEAASSLGPLDAERRRAGEPASESLSAPVLLAGKRVGVLSVEYSADALAARGQSRADFVRAMDLISGRLALGLQLASHHDTQVFERRRLRWLDGARSYLAVSSQQNGIQRAIGSACISAVSELAVASACLLHDGDELRLVCCAHRDPASEHTLRRHARVLSSWLLEHTDGEARLWLDGERGPRFARAARALRCDSVLVLPMRSRKQTFGYLCFALTLRHRDHQGELTCTLGEFASECGAALDTAQLLEQLRDAVEARDTLLALVAHDLRSPINAIALTTSTLSASAQYRAIRQSGPQLELIERSLQRMSHLVDDLLTNANIEVGSFVVDESPLLPSELAREALLLHRPAAEARAVKLVLQDSPEQSEVCADRNRVLQVFSNLILNAINVVESGGRVQLGFERLGDYVRFAVRDDGSGMSAEQLSQVFRRYWRGGTQSGGLGLGLYIAERIVSAHHGRIWAESVPGQGSTFYFTLPIAERGQSRRASHGAQSHYSS